MTNHVALSLFSFSSGESGPGSYDALLREARFADEHGFAAVWIPERHFMEFGSLFSAPAVLLSAIARETRRIALRAGSVVVPLHHPVEVAEQWSVLDHLSGGRAGLACAAGWHPDDFALCPEKYAGRRETLSAGVVTIRRLWSGESIRLASGTGDPVELRLRPRPLQARLPLWLTSAGSDATIEEAACLGANLLTYAALYDVESLAAKIAAYRRSLRAHGHDAEAATVTVWVQTYIGDEEEPARRRGVEALTDYYSRDGRGLFAGLATHHTNSRLRIDDLSADDFREYATFVSERLVTRGMAIFGSRSTCAASLRRLAEIGVNEVACQVDFGLTNDERAATLDALAELQAATPLVHVRTAAPLDEIRARCREELDAERFYAAAARYGFDYGPAFRGAQRVWRRDGEALGLVHTPGTSAALTDACLQVMLAAIPAGAGGMITFRGIGAYRVLRQPGERVWSHARLTSGIGRDWLGDVTVYDDEGQPLVELRNVRGTHLAAAEALDDIVFDVAWEPATPSFAAPAEAMVQEAGSLEELLEVVQSLGAVETPPRLFVITRNAVAAADGDASDPDAAAVWGFIRSARLEYPALRCTLIDLEPGAELPPELMQLDGSEREVALRGGRLFVPRLRRIAPASDRTLDLRGGTYVVSGGTGALGLQVGEWLSARGAAAVVLVGRTTPPDRMMNGFSFVRADIADESSVSALRAHLQSLPPLRGIVHAAGVLDDGVLAQQTLSRMRAVLAPKVRGALNLERLAEGAPLDFFVSFSSIAAAFGSPAQASYAAANAWLGAFAERRRARGATAATIDFGPWQDTGMFANVSEQRRSALATHGIRALPPATALRALEWAIAHDRTRVAVVSLDADALARTIDTPLLAGLTNMTARDSAMREQLLAMSPAERPPLVERYLRDRFGEGMGDATIDFQADLPLTALGLDSLMAVEMRNRVSADLGVHISLIQLMQNATLYDIVAVVCDDLARTAVQTIAQASDAEVLARIDQLPESELDGMLERLLAEEGHG